MSNQQFPDSYFTTMLRGVLNIASSRTFARSFSSSSALAREAGTVKFFNTKKGFGFVEPDDGGNDLFFHATGIRGAEMGKFHAVNDDTRVEFEIGDDSRGPRAIDVSLEGGDELSIADGFSMGGGRNRERRDFDGGSGW